MTSGRAPVFSDDGDLDVSGFAPKLPAPKAMVETEQVRAVSEGASFRSREPAVATPTAPSPPRREPRRYRTGRNVQLNLKVRQEVVDAFYALADGQNWVLGEAFERAVDALKRELSSSE
jgi:hypothetical protein